MEAEIDTQVPKRSYDSAFNPLTQTPQQINNNQMMMDCSNSQALIIVPREKLGAKPKKQRRSGIIPPKKRVAKPKPKKSSAKPKKQGRRRRGRKAPKQTYDEAGCGSSADKTMLWKLVDCLEKDMKYKDITDVNIISEIELTASDVRVQQGRLAFSRKQIRTPFLANSEIEYQKNYKVPVKVIMGLEEYELTLTRWDYRDDSNDSKKKGDDADNNTNNNDNNSNITDNNNYDKNSNDNNNSSSNNSNNNNIINEEKKQPGWKYVIRNGWNRLRKQNNLQVGDWIQLVSFWSENQLHIAIVKYEYIVLGKQKVGEYVVLRS